MQKCIWALWTCFFANQHIAKHCQEQALDGHCSVEGVGLWFSCALSADPWRVMASSVPSSCRKWAPDPCSLASFSRAWQPVAFLCFPLRLWPAKQALMSSLPRHSRGQISSNFKKPYGKNNNISSMQRATVRASLLGLMPALREAGAIFPRWSVSALGTMAVSYICYFYIL